MHRRANGEGRKEHTRKRIREWRDETQRELKKTIEQKKQRRKVMQNAGECMQTGTDDKRTR